MRLFGLLSDIDELIQGKAPEERFNVKLEPATPIWETLKVGAEKHKVTVAKKSKIGGAFAYLLTEYEFLINYLKDRRLEIDNGFTERIIRKFTIGKNNCMFAQSEAGAHAGSLLDSLFVTAKVNGVNPDKALVKLFTKIPKAQSLEVDERLADLILTPEGSALEKCFMARLL